MIDDSYSFLLLDSAGAITWLVVRTEEDMRMYYELARDDGAHALLQSLQQRQQIACFPTLQSNTASADRWHFHPAKQLPRQKIYYCILNGEEGYPLETQKITSYSQFLQKS